MEFLEISEILPFGVDIADPIFRNSVIFVKHMGRYGYGGPPGPSPDRGLGSDSDAWGEILRLGLGFPERLNLWKWHSGSGIHSGAGHCVCECILAVVLCKARSAMACDW